MSFDFPEEGRKYLATKQPCDACGSSDAKAYYTDGGSKCFSCGRAPKHDTPGDAPKPRRVASKNKRKQVTLEEIATFPTTDLPGRGITEATAKMFGVKTELNETTREHEAYYFPYYDDNGQVVGYKARKAASKDFFVVGKLGPKARPFGWNRVSEGGKLLIMTEGEMDALAATQMIREKGKHYKVVSIPNGAHAAAEHVRANVNVLEKFETVMINFDADEQGQDACTAVCDLLPPGHASIMKLPDGVKDANDLLEKGKAYQYMDAINSSKEYRPDGIVSGLDTWEIYKNRPEVQSYTWPEEYEELNKMTYGIRLGELDTITSGTSAGKTQWMREIVYHLVKDTDLKVGILSLEEPITDTIESYIELELGKRISLPDIEASEEERHEAWKQTFGTGQIDLYDAFGGEETSVIRNIRYLARGLGCQAIVVDHLHMLLDGKDSEKEQIERIMLTLKKLTQELGIWIGLIAHLKKAREGRSFEEGEVANLDDLKGSSSIKQLSNGVYVLSRDQQADDLITRNTTQITVKKCRFTGRTGAADRLLFNDDTGRLTVLKANDLPF